MNGNNTYFYDTLFPEENNDGKMKTRLKVGIWHVQVVVESFNNLTNMIQEDLLLVEEFFVMPTYHSESLAHQETGHKSLLRNLINNYWSLESICVDKHDDNLHIKAIYEMSKCDKNAEWSSFYPDPKSSIDYGMINQNRLAVYADYQSKFNSNKQI